MTCARVAAVWLVPWLLLDPSRHSADDAWPVVLTDVAEKAGLHATSVYGGLDRKRFIIETNGAGVALFDYDNDGWIDAFVPSGVRLKDGARENETYAPGAAPRSHLYRNNHHGT